MIASLLFGLAPAIGPPDIVVIVLDDVGYLHGHYGDPADPPTPNLDALAAQGVSFSRCYAAPTCQPGRYALQTGHWWTSDAGIAETNTPGAHTPAFAEKFIPERLPGFESALFGKWHLGACQIPNSSWKSAPLSQGYAWQPLWHSANIGLSYDDWNAVNGTREFQVTDYYPDVLVDAFVTGYAVNLGAPRFTVINHAFAHAPFHDPGGHGPFGYLAQATIKYGWMIERLDQDIGRILAEFDLTDTLVIVVGDNGTPPQVGGQRAKATCYELGLRVPMIVAGAGVTRHGVVSNELVWIGDVYATAIAAGGGTLPRSPIFPVRSRDLGPILTGSTWTPRTHVVTGHNWETGLQAARCIVTEDQWKLIQNDTDGDGDVDSEELYDLANDPDELTNRIGFSAALAGTLRSTLEAESIP